MIFQNHMRQPLYSVDSQFKNCENHNVIILILIILIIVILILSVPEEN